MATTYLTRTPGSSSNQIKWTWSAWFKSTGGASGIGGGTLLGAYTDSNNYTQIDLSSSIDYYNVTGGSVDGRLTTSRLFRDPAAWYHIVVVWDSANGSATERMKLYINGVEETSFSATTNPTSSLASIMNSTAPQAIGARGDGGAGFFDGEMAHVHFCDGQAYAASDFGETDATSGIWVAKSGPSVTYGTNGYFLKFASGATLTDSSGEGNNMTLGAGTLTTTKDSPDNNFSTWTPLYVPTANLPTFENGNTTTIHATATGGWRTMESTIGVSKGKWYWETIGGNSSGHIYCGVCSPEWLESGDPASTGPEGEMGFHVAQPSYGVYALNGNMVYSNTSGFGNIESAFTSTADENDYWSVYVDLDNHKIYWSINGVIQNSGTGWDLQTGFTYIPCVSLYNSTAAGAKANFGNGTFASTALGGTTYSDDDGIGIFKYSPNYGGAATFDSSAKNFMALCTTNLATYG